MTVIETVPVTADASPAGRCPFAGLPEKPRFPFVGDVEVEPTPLYAALREERPVFEVTTPEGKRAWLVTRYRDAKLVLTDNRFTREGTLDERTVQAMGVTGPGGRSALIYADPPMLTDARKLISHHFNASRVAALRPLAQSIVDELIDTMTTTGAPADVLTGFARPLPIRIICALLGIPFSESEQIRESVDVLMTVTGRGPDEIRDAFMHAYGYLGTLVAARRAAPADDLVSDLIRTEETDDPLTDGELIGLAMLLFVTGHETTMTQIANSVYTLLQQPDQWALLRDDLTLLDTAIEELLRFVPLGHAGLPFAASEDVDVASVRINRGDLVYVSKLSANRDESVFPVAHRLDLTRTPNKHVAFSHGPHYCLGASLARMELQVAIGTLVRRLPDLRLAVDQSELTWRTDSIQRGPAALPVAW